MDPCYAVYRFTVQLTELQLLFRSTILRLRLRDVRGEHLSSITGFRTSVIFFVQLCGLFSSDHLSQAEICTLLIVSVHLFLFRLICGLPQKIYFTHTCA